MNWSLHSVGVPKTAPTAWTQAAGLPAASRSILGSPLVFLLILTSGLVGTGWADPSPVPISGGPLNQLSLTQLGDVEVTTVSKEPEEVWKTPAAVFVVTQDDIRRSGATTIPDVLRLVPGVEVAQVDADHWSIGIRGFGAALASKLLVLIDG